MGLDWLSNGVSISEVAHGPLKLLLCHTGGCGPAIHPAFRTSQTLAIRQRLRPVPPKALWHRGSHVLAGDDQAAMFGRFSGLARA